MMFVLPLGHVGVLKLLRDAKDDLDKLNSYGTYYQGSNILTTQFSTFHTLFWAQFKVAGAGRAVEENSV